MTRTLQMHTGLQRNEINKEIMTGGNLAKLLDLMVSIVVQRDTGETCEQIAIGNIQSVVGPWSSRHDGGHTGTRNACELVIEM